MPLLKRVQGRNAALARSFGSTANGTGPLHLLSHSSISGRSRCVVSMWRHACGHTRVNSSRCVETAGWRLKSVFRPNTTCVSLSLCVFEACGPLPPDGRVFLEWVRKEFLQFSALFSPSGKYFLAFLSMNGAKVLLWSTASSCSLLKDAAQLLPCSVLNISLVSPHLSHAKRYPTVIKAIFLEPRSATTLLVYVAFYLRFTLHRLVICVLQKQVGQLRPSPSPVWCKHMICPAQIATFLIYWYSNNRTVTGRKCSSTAGQREMNLNVVFFLNVPSSGKTFSRWGRLPPLKFQSPLRTRQNALHWDLTPLVTWLEDAPPFNFQKPSPVFLFLFFFLRKKSLTLVVEGHGSRWMKMGIPCFAYLKRIISPL